MDVDSEVGVADGSRSVCRDGPSFRRRGRSRHRCDGDGRHGGGRC